MTIMTASRIWPMVRIRFIGLADARVEEDYLRILRFFRFFGWYGRPRL
jgi:poly(A) polymerase